MVGCGGLITLKVHILWIRANSQVVYILSPWTVWCLVIFHLLMLVAVNNQCLSLLIHLESQNSNVPILSVLSHLPAGVLKNKQTKIFLNLLFGDPLIEKINKQIPKQTNNPPKKNKRRNKKQKNPQKTKTKPKQKTTTTKQKTR